MLDNGKSRWTFQFSESEIKNNIKYMKLMNNTNTYAMMNPLSYCDVGYMVQGDGNSLCKECPYSFKIAWCMRKDYTLSSRLK